MSKQELILEKLGFQKIFKDEIKAVWNLLSRSQYNDTTVTIMPSFTVILPSGIPDLSKMYLTFPYVWSLDTCGIVEKVKDFLIFGVKLDDFKIDINGPSIRGQLMSSLEYEYHGNRLESIKNKNHVLFYNFCKDTLGLPDDHIVYNKDYQAFFDSVEFNYGMINRCKDYAEKAWRLSKPLKCSIEGVPEHILPLVYYSISRRECYYLPRYSAKRLFAYKIKLDLRTLQSNSFGLVFIDHSNKVKINAGFPRNSISNYRYEFT